MIKYRIPLLARVNRENETCASRVNCYSVQSIPLLSHKMLVIRSGSQIQIYLITDGVKYYSSSMHPPIYPMIQEYILVHLLSD